MRIAIVINTSWNIFNYRKGLIKSLLANGHEVIAIAPKDEFSNELINLGCKFVDLPMDNKGINPFKDIFLLLRFVQVYSEIKPDYVFHYTIKPNVFGSIACGFLGIRCISNVSGLGTVFIRKGWILEIVKVLYKIAFKIPQRVFFQNSDDQKLFLELGILMKDKTGLLPGSGINTSDYVPEIFKRNEPFKFLLIARLLKDKGIFEYAAASKLLKEKGIKFESFLVGFFDRESEYNISIEDITNWEKEGYIIFLDRKSVV